MSNSEGGWKDCIVDHQAQKLNDDLTPRQNTIGADRPLRDRTRLQCHVVTTRRLADFPTCESQKSIELPDK